MAAAESQRTRIFGFGIVRVGPVGHRQRCQRPTQHRDVVGGGVAPGVAGSQQTGQRESRPIEGATCCSMHSAQAERRTVPGESRPRRERVSSPRRFRPTGKGRCQAQTRPGSRSFGPAPLGVRFGWRHVRERCATCDYRSARPRWSQRQAGAGALGVGGTQALRGNAHGHHGYRAHHPRGIPRPSRPTRTGNAGTTRATGRTGTTRGSWTPSLSRPRRRSHRPV